MKKILNDPYRLCGRDAGEACAWRFRSTTSAPAPAAASSSGPAPPRQGKVGVVSGGGSGHLPVFTGYVGKGLLDACAIGEVFASPSVEQMADAMRAANGGAGVLRALRQLRRRCHELRHGRRNDGNGGRSLHHREAGRRRRLRPAGRGGQKRRGVAGIVYAYKIAGAAAEEGQRPRRGHPHRPEAAADACRTVGAALTPCTVPQAGRPTFTIAEDEMEMGMGIHGEPGVWRGKLRPAEAIAAEMLDMLLADRPIAQGRPRLGAGQQPGRHPAGGTVASSTATCMRAWPALGATIVMPLVGRYACSMEMSGRFVHDHQARRGA